MTHLDGQLSPYLQAHRDNPVDWYPWGKEAFDEAKRRDVPVLISIGYHTCHWCHVMARESFQDPEIGALVNERMVAIKVDREEHPDVDQLYLTQAGAFIEQLGWPLTVFATPDGDTFHAATYLPPEPRGNVPSFAQVVSAVTEAWTQHRDQVVGTATSLRHALADADREGRERAVTRTGSIEWDAILSHLASQEDPELGGFGQAPKFPNAPIQQFLLSVDSSEARALALRNLKAMADSPLRDAVDGGFFRYATLGDWSEPHYERMLYDNAGLLWCYATAGMDEVAQGIVRFLNNQMRVTGGLASAQDSESIIDGEKVEGGYYLLDAQSRATAEPPAIDDKVLTGWNGLALHALARAQAAGVGGEPGMLADEIAENLVSRHLLPGGRLIRMSRGGENSPAAATLEDFGGLARGLLEWGLVAGSLHWLTLAKNLLDSCMPEDPRGTFITPGGGDPLVAAIGAVGADVSEGSSPSGLALIAETALIISQLTGQRHYRTVAQASVQPYAEAVRLRPLAFGGLATVLYRLDQEPRELVVVCDDPSHPLAHAATRHLAPGWVATAVSRATARELAEAGWELFAHRFDQPQPQAFVCHAGVCALPVSELGQLTSLLTSTN